jgi:hypothetical protein
MPRMRCKRMVLEMVFVEITPIIAFLQRHWSDDELRELQNFLLATPAAGKVIRGSNGLRKLRWSLPGRGKRGGARVIYYRYVEGDRLYLIYAYAKAIQEDLTPEQVAVLAELIKEIDHG